MSDIEITHEKLRYFLTIERSYNAIADLFSLTEKERNSENAGDWMIDRIKQFQTGYILRKSIIDKEAYPVDTGGTPDEK